MNSTRPIDFLPVEYAGVRGIDQKMYKEQESLNLKSEKDIYTTYRTYYTSLPTHDTLPGRLPIRTIQWSPFRQDGLVLWLTSMWIPSWTLPPAWVSSLQMQTMTNEL
ncbi:hypothetical protein EMCRGX_G002168 [Ephydatia muelleri]